MEHRYVGTLVEINSTDSTVALENVRSYGTEDRKTGKDFFPASDSVYEYILFRGSDVKDLRVESRPNEPSQPQEPPMPADPAILGVSTAVSLIPYCMMQILRM
jgi:protein LSM14